MIFELFQSILSLGTIVRILSAHLGICLTICGSLHQYESPCLPGPEAPCLYNCEITEITSHFIKALGYRLKLTI